MRKVFISFELILEDKHRFVDEENEKPLNKITLRNVREELTDKQTTSSEVPGEVFYPKFITYSIVTIVEIITF